MIIHIDDSCHLLAVVIADFSDSDDSAWLPGCSIFLAHDDIVGFLRSIHGDFTAMVTGRLPATLARLDHSTVNGFSITLTASPF